MAASTVARASTEVSAVSAPASSAVAWGSPAAEPVVLLSRHATLVSAVPASPVWAICVQAIQAMPQGRAEAMAVPRTRQLAFGTVLGIAPISTPKKDEK
jgi:hypothetical protein